MRIFISGGSGFVGGHICEHLTARGHDVLAMARSASSADAVREFGATPVACSLTDIAAEHLAGCDVVVHAAAKVEEWGPREQFFQMNVEGTRRMLDAARSAGVARFIHIGTEAALFDGGDLVDVDETAPYPARHRFLYSETKAAAEQLVLDANDDDFVTISLRPRLVWGPRDATILPAIKRMVEDGSYTWVDGGRHLTSTVHIANVTHAVELALTRGVGGRAYFIADDGVRTIRDFITALLATADIDLGTRSIPGAVLRPVAAAVEGLWGLLGKTTMPPVTRLAANMMSATVTVSTARAVAELGYVPVIDVERGLADLAAARG